MTTKQIIESRINDLEGRIKANDKAIEYDLEQIQQGGNTIDRCRMIIDEYDFLKEQNKQYRKDLQLLQLAMKAINEESK